MDSMQNENENSDIIELLEKSLKSSKKKIRDGLHGRRPVCERTTKAAG